MPPPHSTQFANKKYDNKENVSNNLISQNIRKSKKKKETDKIYGKQEEKYNFIAFRINEVCKHFLKILTFNCEETYFLYMIVYFVFFFSLRRTLLFSYFEILQQTI